MIQKPKTDPIVEEIHEVRREISDRFDGDVRAIAADANARMVASDFKNQPTDSSEEP